MQIIRKTSFVPGNTYLMASLTDTKENDPVDESTTKKDKIDEISNVEPMASSETKEEEPAPSESVKETISPNDIYIEFLNVTDHIDDSVSSIVSKFNSLLTALSSNNEEEEEEQRGKEKEEWTFHLEQIRKQIKGISFKHSKFIHSHKSLLVKRIQECRSNGASTSLSALKKALIIGAGPGGLRMAVNLALLGCRDITVMDRRDYFTRKQIVAIWDLTYRDLEALGIRDVVRSFNKAAGSKLIPITFLQHFLLRVALLLNVKVITNRRFETIDFKRKKIVFLNTENWNNPKREELDNDFDAVIDASGTNAVVRDMPLIVDQEQKDDGVVEDVEDVTDSKEDQKGNSKGSTEKLLIGKKAKREKNAIYGITCNFDRVPKDHTKKMILGKAFFLFQDEFKSKKVRLENIVYFRSVLSNYLVATVRKQSLREFKIFVDPKKRGKSLLKKDNIERDNLRKLILQIATEWDIPKRKDDENPFNRIKGASGEREDFSIFEFAKLAECAQPIKFVKNGYDDDEDGFEMIACVGDSAQAPFWPKGTGVNHAFIGCYLLGQHLQRWVTQRGDEKVRAEIEKKAKKDFDDLSHDLSDMNWHRERVNALYMKDW